MNTDRMSWQKLLDTTRVRELMVGQRSLGTPDHRSEYERDRDRTVFSAPFRRLVGKTQVFPLDPNDHVRTRLVHSLEVSTVAEGLASQVVRKVISKREAAARSLTNDELQAIPKIAETCGLLHDIGNPPFGHAGEAAIGSWFQNKREELGPLLGGVDSARFQDLANFEGNAQTMRIATNLFLLGHDYGLNLTCATTAAARKYLASSTTTSEQDHVLKKPGFFSSERTILDRVAEKTGTAGRRHPITFLVEAADDIVYSMVDLEDGIKNRKLTWARAHDYLRSKCGADEGFRRVIEQTLRQAGPMASDTEMSQSFRVHAISEAVRVAVDLFDLRYDAIMEGVYRAELIEDEEYVAKGLVGAAKSLLRETVFRDDEVMRLEVRGRKVLHDLLDLFWEGAQNYLERRKTHTKDYGGKLYLLIAESSRRLFQNRLERCEKSDRETANVDNHYAALQMVTDYVSGMTDGFACRIHKDLMNG